MDVGLAQARRPLNTRFHYYELEITDAGEKCYIALGLARRVRASSFFSRHHNDHVSLSLTDLVLLTVHTLRLSAGNENLSFPAVAPRHPSPSYATLLSLFPV